MSDYPTYYPEHGMPLRLDTPAKSLQKINGNLYGLLQAYNGNANNTYTEGVVTNGSSTFFARSTGTQTPSTYRKAYVVTADCSQLHLHYGGYTTSSGQIVALAWGGKASVQLADDSGNPTGSAIPVTFGGSSSFSVNGNTVRSDTINVTLSKGQILFVLTYNSTNDFPVNCLLNAVSGDNIAFGVDYTQNAAGITNDGSQIGISAVGPSLITGTTLESNKLRAVIGVGDSIMQGFNDCATGYQWGWLGRALGGDYGYVNVGVGGSTAYAVSSDPTAYAAIYYPAQYCGAAVYDYGYNDFYASDASLAEMQSYTSIIVSTLRGLGIEKVVGCTVLPKTTSTDGWTTLANQTIVLVTGRVPYNDWVIANSGTPFDGVFDFNATLADPSNLQKRNPGPATVVATDTAGAATTLTAIRTSANGVGAASWAGATLKWVHSGTTYYGQIKAYRPSLVGGLNLVFTVGLLGTETIAAGDTYTIIDSWDGDTEGGGGHPNGYGHANAAAQAASILVPLIASLVPPDPGPGAYLPLSGGIMTGTLVFASSQTTATTAAPNIVQLTDSVASTSTTTAATPNSVKSAYDLATTANTTAAAALPKSGGTMTGQILGLATGVAYSFVGDTTTGLSRTAAGVLGFTVSGNLKLFLDGSIGQLCLNRSSNFGSDAQIEVTMDASTTKVLAGIGYGKAPRIDLIGVGLTAGLPSATTTAQIGRYGFAGQDNVTAGSTTYSLSGNLEITPSTTWTSTDHGTAIGLYYTPSGSTTRTLALNIAAANGNVEASVGNVSIATAGKGVVIKAGTGGRIGTVTLTAGSGTVANTTITANSYVFLTLRTASGTVGQLPLVTLNAGVGFTLTGGSLDASTYGYFIVESQ